MHDEGISTLNSCSSFKMGESLDAQSGFMSSDVSMTRNAWERLMIPPFWKSCLGSKMSTILLLQID